MDPTVSFPVATGAPVVTAPMGIGTWAWGDKSTWGMGGYDSALNEDTIAEAWAATIDAGVTLFDTAEVYGNGESERIIGRLLAADPSMRPRLALATKFLPMPWKLDVGRSMRVALEQSLERLGTDQVDLYQVHGPISLRGHAALAEALASLVGAGLTRAVGVSNYSIREMGRVHDELHRRGVPLASNQIEFSLLRRGPESSGLLAECRRLGVVPLAYSPIGQGRLTGKYSAQNPPPGDRGFSDHPMEQVDTVVAELRRVGDHTGHTPSQVALRWIIEHGAVPIPGAKNGKQATDNAGGLGWTLDPSDAAALDRVALDGIVSWKSRLWQHG